MKYYLLITILFILGCVFWKKVRLFGELIVAPGYSTCQKCGGPWKFVNGHSVWYNNYEGTFAVCEECWNNSTLKELKRYYAEVYQDQLKDGMANDHFGALMDSVESEYNKTHHKSDTLKHPLGYGLIFDYADSASSTGFKIDSLVDDPYQEFRRDSVTGYWTRLPKKDGFDTIRISPGHIYIDSIGIGGKIYVDTNIAGSHLATQVTTIITGGVGGEVGPLRIPHYPPENKITWWQKFFFFSGILFWIEVLFILWAVFFLPDPID